MLTAIRSEIGEIEVINILKGCSDKKTQEVKKPPAFLFVANWSYLAHFWPGLKYMCKEKHKTLGNN